jgi:hypothetical protein
MNTKIITREEKAIYEKVHKALKEEKRELFFSHLTQKLAGVVMIALGIITPFVLDGDATVSILMIPAGIWALVTKDDIM